MPWLRQRPMSTKTGIPTSATFVFVNTSRQAAGPTLAPQYLAADFDLCCANLPRRASDGQLSATAQVRNKTQTFGHKAYGGYKANRVEMPEDLPAANTLHPARARSLPHSHPRSRFRSRRRHRHAGAQGRRRRLLGVRRLQRQGHDAVGRRPHLRAESPKDNLICDAAKVEEDPRRAAGQGG